MTALRGAATLLALLFVVAAALQYNDPDPQAWIAIYLAAASACTLTVLARPFWPLPAAVAAVALAWAGWLVPAAEWNFAALWGAWEMQNERIELGREMYGLLIVAAACGGLAIAQARAARAARPAAPTPPRP